MNTLTSELRKAPRASLDCRLYFIGENDFESEARILDISTSGCRADCEMAVDVGDTFELSLFLPDHPWPLRIEKAVVRWVDGYTFGLQFTVLRPAQRERLRQLVMKVKTLGY